jgi:O-methyltransferase involved in polyketide biosynthesis
LADALVPAGFDSTQPTFFTWLGVVPYLTQDAIFSTLRFVANVSGGASVVFDYANPPASISQPKGRTALEALATRVAALGEPFKPISRRSNLARNSRLWDFAMSKTSPSTGRRAIFSRAEGSLPAPALTSCGRQRAARSVADNAAEDVAFYSSARHHRPW